MSINAQKVFAWCGVVFAGVFGLGDAARRDTAATFPVRHRRGDRRTSGMTTRTFSASGSS